MNVKEIFYSYQAEGKYIGSPTLFIRFSGCNLRCYYCDTKYALKQQNGKYYSVDQLVYKVQKLINTYKPSFVSLTGGEPLLQTELKDFLEKLTTDKKFKIYLETNASLPEAFKKIVKFIDVCALNVKLPKDDKLKLNVLNKTEKVLRLCQKYKKEFIVKIVIGKNLYMVEDINQIKKFLQKNKVKEIILQPETKSYKKGNKNMFINLCNIFSSLSEFIPRIYIIPQLHKFVWQIK